MRDVLLVVCVYCDFLRRPMRN